MLRAISRVAAEVRVTNARQSQCGLLNRHTRANENDAHNTVKSLSVLFTMAGSRSAPTPFLSNRTISHHYNHSVFDSHLRGAVGSRCRPCRCNVAQARSAMLLSTSTRPLHGQTHREQLMAKFKVVTPKGASFTVAG